MGIHDRDYMRRGDRGQAEPPRSAAPQGLTLAVCIAVGMLAIDELIALGMKETK